MTTTSERMLLGRAVLVDASASPSELEDAVWRQLFPLLSQKFSLKGSLEALGFYSAWLSSLEDPATRLPVALRLAQVMQPLGNDPRPILLECVRSVRQSSLFISLGKASTESLAHTLAYFLLAYLACTSEAEGDQIIPNIHLLCSSSLEEGRSPVLTLSVLLILQTYSAKDRSVLLADSLSAVKRSKTLPSEDDLLVLILLLHFLHRRRADAKAAGPMLKACAEALIAVPAMVNSQLGPLLLGAMQLVWDTIVSSCDRNLYLKFINALMDDQTPHIQTSLLSLDLSLFAETLPSCSRQSVLKQAADNGDILFDDQSGSYVTTDVASKLNSRRKAMHQMAIKRMQVHPQELHPAGPVMPSVEQWIVPDADALLSNWPKTFANCLFYDGRSTFCAHGLVVPRGLLDELDYRKQMPWEQSNAKAVLKLIETAQHERPATIQLAATESRSDISLRDCAGLVKSQVDIMRVLVQRHRRGSPDLVISDDAVFVATLRRHAPGIKIVGISSFVALHKTGHPK